VFTTINDSRPSIPLSHRRSSIDGTSTSLLRSTLPLATDLCTLPGHTSNNTRDHRFVDYVDANTLVTHFHTCLHIDKKSSLLLNRQHIFKTRHNILNKIFKLDYMKMLRSLTSNDCDLFSSRLDNADRTVSSSTALSFRTDWSIYRHRKSSHRTHRTNFFHHLQMHPKRELFVGEQQRTANEDRRVDLECIKHILVRTYCPHLHTSIEHGPYFGMKPQLTSKDESKPMIVSNCQMTTDDDTPILLRSPQSTDERESSGMSWTRRGRKRQANDGNEPVASVRCCSRRVSEEIPSVPMKESIVVSVPIRSDTNGNDRTRKRKQPRTIEQVIDKKKRRFVSTERVQCLSTVSLSDR
jgi:hypothetical protein